MGMFDIVRFSEKLSKELDLPDGEFQTKDFDEPGLCKIEISELVHKDGVLFIEPTVFGCYSVDELNYYVYVTVVIGNGKVLKCSKTSSRDSHYVFDDLRIMPKLACPACRITGCVFSENSSVKCGACNEDLVLAVSKPCKISAKATGSKCL